MLTLLLHIIFSQFLQYNVILWYKYGKKAIKMYSHALVNEHE